MNRFVKYYANGKTIIRDCCDKPLDCTVSLHCSKTVHFKLGVLTDDGLIYAEHASDSCAMFGNPAGYKFVIEGKVLDLRDVGKKEAIELMAKTIDNVNQQDCLIQDDEDFVI